MLLHSFVPSVVSVRGCVRTFLSLVVRGCVHAVLFWLLHSWQTIQPASHRYYQQRQALWWMHPWLANDPHAGGFGRRHSMDADQPTRIWVWCQSKHWRSWSVVRLDWAKIESPSIRDLCFNRIARSKMQRLLPKTCCTCCHCWKEASIHTMRQIDFWFVCCFKIFVVFI